MSEKGPTIVIGTSLERSSDPVVRTGLGLTRRVGARLCVVHAFPMPAVYSGTAMSSGILVPATQHEEKRCRAVLGEQLARVGGRFDEIERVVLEPGPAHIWLHETAEELEADLVIVGAHEGGPLTAVLGSTADRVLRKSTCPVLVLRSVFEPPIDHVLAPVDLSTLSRHSLERGLQWLTKVQEETPAKVDVLFVLSRVDREGSVNFSPEQVDRFAALELERFGDHLEVDLRVEPHIRVGLAKTEIFAFLDEHPVDLLIIGTHGRSGFERFMLGSIAAGIVRHAKVNVLVVPPHDERAQSKAAAGGLRSGVVGG